MARETKVGLLAGLAFIVCFAVILANRGRNGPPGLLDSVLNDASATLPAVVRPSSSPVRNSKSALSVDGPRASSPSQAARPPVAHQPGPMAARLSDATPASGAELPDQGNLAEALPRMAPRQAPGAGPYPVGDQRDVIGRGPTDSNHDTLERLLASRSQPSPSAPLERIAAGGPTTPSANSTPNAPQIHAGQLGQVDPRSDARSVAGTTNQPGRDPRAVLNDHAALGGKEYTVKPSDTLSSIAAANYGSKSRGAVNAIFDANRSILSDPDHLKVGTVLILPTAPPESRAQLGDLGAATQTVPTASPVKSVDAREARAVAEQAAAVESAAIRWYQVRKNDRYASIAREQLGDAGRWKELYDLNKDKFPDPQRIREGVRIKLPLMVAQGGKESRR